MGSVFFTYLNHICYHWLIYVIFSWKTHPTVIKLNTQFKHKRGNCFCIFRFSEVRNKLLVEEWNVEYKVCRTRMVYACKILYRLVQIMARTMIICTIITISMIRFHQLLVYRQRSQVLCHPVTIVWIICHMTRRTTIIITTACRIHRLCMNHLKN